MPTSASTTDTTTRAKGIDYGIDAWKVALIDDRARLRGYRRDELDEVRQELAPTIAAFVFDHAKSNGACERTVLISIIDNQLTMALRTRARWQQFRSEYAAEMTLAERDRTERQDCEHVTESNRRIDVERAINLLWEPDRVIALALAGGESLRDLSKRLNRSRYDLGLAVERIRDHFLACGLDAWVRG